MKTKLSLTIILLIAHLSLLTAQVPQGFNYQAIARLTTGDPIINTTLPVRITIQADSLGTSIIWQELHSSVITNGFGLINLVIGKGARQAASTVATFSAIDWTVTPKFIKTEIDFSGWKTMGVTRFWSVPYSLNTANVTGTLSKLSVKGKTAINDEALFEVKNKDGQTVFAVYNEGVRVYVSDGAKGLKGGFAVGGFGTDKAVSTPYFIVGKDSVRVYLDTNPLTKKLKGGFAVGGYDLLKGTVQDYLDVNSDSVRIYIDSNPATKKLKGGFAVGGYDMTKGTNTNYMNVNTDASGIINPSQNRILWYPLKNAFLTGRILVENKDSVGVNSFSSGYESMAKGQYSQALGYQAVARGNYSTSIGYQSIANKDNSFAFGQWAMAKNEESYALGRGAIADGFRSFAFGSAGIDSAGQTTGVAYAKGDYSFAIGQGSQSIGSGAFAFGLADTAKGDFTLAMGYKSSSRAYSALAMGSFAKAIGSYSIAIGDRTMGSGTHSTAIGYFNKASGLWSTALGVGSEASGEQSLTLGFQCVASGDGSTAMGFSSISSGTSSTTIGYETAASGILSMALGYHTTASGYVSVAMGNSTISPSGFETVIGSYNTEYSPSAPIGWNSTDRLFVIGNGSGPSSRSNAITVLKNGRIGLQTVTNPTYALELPNSTTLGIGHARANAWDTYSDGRAKANRILLPYGLQDVLKLKPQMYFQFDVTAGCDGLQIQNTGSINIGLIAQEVYKIIPEIVYKPENEEKDLWSISYDKLMPVIIKAMQEQQQQIESEKQENQQLKSQLQSLQEEVEQIKAMLAKGGGN